MTHLLARAPVEVRLDEDTTSCTAGACGWLVVPAGFISSLKVTANGSGATHRNASGPLVWRRWVHFACSSTNGRGEAARTELSEHEQLIEDEEADPAVPERERHEAKVVEARAPHVPQHVVVARPRDAEERDRVRPRLRTLAFARAWGGAAERRRPLQVCVRPAMARRRRRSPRRLRCNGR